MKSNKKSDIIPPLKNIFNNEEQYFFTDEEKANCLNNFFVSVSNLNDDGVQLPAFNRYTDTILSDVSICQSEVTDMIKTLNTNKAVGEDSISHKVIKSVSTSISRPLCQLFNKSLSQGIFPSSWKSAMVMPLFKKGDSHSASNYRPISLLSCLGKLMERVVYKYIYNHLMSNKLIFHSQSGFLKNHSTVYQLIDIYHQITQSIDSGTHTCIVFCDISKAFDRVWHKGLIFKLKQNGLDGNILKWVENYLSDRKQKVIVGSSVSKSMPITAEVSQGCVLGPLLFLVYVNDIADQLLSVTRLFADDTSLASSTSNISDLEGIMNHDLAIISNWSKQWLVDFNPNKTEAILFNTRNEVAPNLVFDNVPVKFVQNHKHLGLTFSADGKWHEHIENISTSASKVLGIMRNLKYKLRRKTLNQLYISFLRPLLEYASVVWDNCTQYEKETLERIQHEAARIVTGTTRSISLVNLYKEIGWLSLSDRRKYQKLTYIYKIVHNLTPDYLSNLVPNTVGNVSDYNLRNNFDLVTVARRTEIFSNSFFPQR